MRFFPILAGVILAGLSAVVATQGQTPHEHGDVPAGDNGAQAAYSPGLGEIMALQQMRHAKLWFAGRARNWELAAYELDELKEGFADVGRLFPTHDKVPLTPMVEAITAKEIPDLAQAIEARDRGKFAAAFDRLTAACNGCHQAANHGFISIHRPGALPYTNQSFVPPPQR